MPCTEASFNDSLIREPKGLSKYNTDEFNEHCQKKADQVIYEIKNIINSGYEVIAILGIEHSPSCCANYIYTNKGNEKRKGIFIEKIYDGLKEYNIPIIGINRKYIRKSLMELEVLSKGTDSASSKRSTSILFEKIMLDNTNNKRLVLSVTYSKIS